MSVSFDLRDQGLVRRIGAWALTAAIVNGVIGAGIFSLPQAMAAAAGAWAPLAYLACAVVMGAVVACFAEAGSRLPTSGGAAGYVGAAFGPAAGFVAGMLTWLSCVLAAGGIASALALSVGALAPALNTGAGRAAVIVAALGGLGWLNLRGVDVAARFVTLGTAVKLLPLVLLVALGGVFLAGHAAPPPVATHADFGRAMLLALFAFSGMETPIAASGEVARPNRSVPLALFAAMGTVLALYVGLQLVSAGLLGPTLAGTATPLADAAGVVWTPGRAALLTAASISMLVWIGSDTLGAPRLLFGFARDGVLPPAFGRLNAAHVPGVAIVVHVLLAIALALTGSFVQLAVLAELGSAGLYLLAAAAALRLRARNTIAAGPPLRVPGLRVIAPFAIAAMLVVIALARPVEILGFAVSIALSLGLFRLSRRYLPA